MKISERLNKLVDDGFITPLAVEEASKKGWITAQQKTAMVKKAEEKIVAVADKLQEKKGKP